MYEISLIIEAPALLPSAPHFATNVLLARVSSSIDERKYDFLHSAGKGETCFVQPDGLQSLLRSLLSPTTETKTNHRIIDLVVPMLGHGVHV